MFSFPVLLTLYAGFIHAFEADHLLGIGNIVSQRDNTRGSVKDGLSWGLGHASTLLVIGVLTICFKAAITTAYFHYFEAAAGLMLTGLAGYRLIKFFRGQKVAAHHHHPSQAGGKPDQLHVHVPGESKHLHNHSLAYGVGLIHGLAGSGALILAVILKVKSSQDGLMYILVFGGGCIGGMMLAAGLCSIPFSKNIIQARALQTCLVLISSLLCFLYGSKILYDNL